MAKSEYSDEIVFEQGSGLVTLEDKEEIKEGQEQKSAQFPSPIIEDIDPAVYAACKVWLDKKIMSLKASHSELERRYAELEAAYRALPGPAKRIPFEGACNDVVPAIAMAVDPIQARLSTGVLKQEPVFRFKALKKSVLKYTKALERFVDYYQKHRWQLRRVATPQFFEFSKLGTMVFKTIYDREEADIMTYDSNFKVVKKRELRYHGPRVVAVPLANFYFAPGHQHIQDSPIAGELFTTSFGKLKVAEASGKLANVDELKGQERNDNRNEVDIVRQEATGHESSALDLDDLRVWELWFDYDINGDGLPEHLVAVYHEGTRTLLRLSYNWYFHQRKPYTVIPYTVTNGSPLGLGIAEMVLPFQIAITRWHQMASDNAYLANIRMYVARKNCGIEEVPRLYAGRTFFVDDPDKDFKPFQAAEIYPSSLAERQNLFGLMEKRTGVSDYLTGRESPIIGSRATATSTLALIQEGTKRVEEVLENIRVGFSEILENAIYIWIQYGPEGVDDLVFGDDEVGLLVKEFFNSVSEVNVNGALAIDLTATDANSNKQAMQQMQLSIIQIMMQYLEKLLQAGEAALMAMKQGMPEYSQMVADVMTAARKMFEDLLQKYDIRNAEEYLPDLQKYLNLQGGPLAGTQVPLGAGSPGLPGAASGVAPESDFPPLPPGAGQPNPAGPGAPAVGRPSPFLASIAG